MTDLTVTQDRSNRTKIGGTHTRPPGTRGPWSEWVNVTPELATTWLTASASYAEKHGVRVNRRPSPGAIEQYSRDMLNQRWTETGVPVIIDVRNVVIDGQQRLAAIVKSGKATRLNVVFGVQPEVQENIDKGRRRTVGDDLTIRGVPDAMHVASTASLLVAWRSGKIANTGFAPTPAEVNAFIRTNEQDIITAVRDGRRLKNHVNLGTVSVFSAASFASRRVDATASAEFFEALRVGSNLAERDPILTLRNTIGRYDRLNRKPHRNYQLYQVVQAWNAWRSGQDAHYLRVPKVLVSSAFPVMK